MVLVPEGSTEPWNCEAHLVAVAPTPSTGLPIVVPGGFLRGEETVVRVPAPGEYQLMVNQTASLPGRASSITSFNTGLRIEVVETAGRQRVPLSFDSASGRKQ